MSKMTEREICERISDNRSCLGLSCRGQKGHDNEGTNCPLDPNNGHCISGSRARRADKWLADHQEEEETAQPEETTSQCHRRRLGRKLVCDGAQCPFNVDGACVNGCKDPQEEETAPAPIGMKTLVKTYPDGTREPVTVKDVVPVLNLLKLADSFLSYRYTTQSHTELASVCFELMKKEPGMIPVIEDA